jgi:hypothetical protein
MFHVEQFWQALGQDWSIEPTRISEPVAECEKPRVFHPWAASLRPRRISNTQAAHSASECPWIVSNKSSVKANAL